MGTGLTRVRALVVVCGLLLLSACTKDIPYQVLEKRYANAQSRYLDLGGGVRVHYRDEGPKTAPPIVLVHGFSASLHAWEPWVARLTPDYRVVSLDLPGHGLTLVPDGYQITPAAQVGVVDAVTRKVGLTRFVIGGNSMGGGVAWRYALAHPERVRGLVLVDAAGWPDAKGDKPPLVFKLLANPVGRALLGHVDPRPLVKPGLEDAYLAPSVVTPALVDRYVDFALAPGRRKLMTSGARPRPVNDPAIFARIKAPTLVMHGGADGLIPVAAGRGFAGAIPGAELIVYPGVGHVPMETIPDRSAADLRAFLQALPAEPAAPQRAALSETR